MITEKEFKKRIDARTSETGFDLHKVQIRWAYLVAKEMVSEALSEVNNLDIPVVSSQRELLIAQNTWHNNLSPYEQGYYNDPQKRADKFLSDL